jgi:hypothetical protein
VPVYGDYSLGGENTIRGWPPAPPRRNQFINTMAIDVRPRDCKVFGFNLRRRGGGVFGDVGAVWSDPADSPIDSLAVIADCRAVHESDCRSVIWRAIGDAF